MSCSVFKDTTEMPPDATADDNNAPVRARQVGRTPAGALAPFRLGVEDNSVVNVSRPRRGHDY